MKEWVNDIKEWLVSLWEKVVKWYNDRYGDPYDFPPDD